MPLKQVTHQSTAFNKHKKPHILTDMINGKPPISCSLTSHLKVENVFLEVPHFLGSLHLPEIKSSAIFNEAKFV